MTAYQFAGCELNPERRELRYEDQVRHLEPQVFDLLLLLVQSGGRVVTKDEIIERIWDGRAISDDALASRIKKARRAIGDDGRRQSLIRTRPRIGYQFTGTLDSLKPRKFLSHESTPPAMRPCQALEPAKRNALPLPSSDAVTVAKTAARPVTRVPSLAVMPFIELGPSVGGAFTDCLVEEINSALSCVHDFVVVARQSAYAYSGRFVDARDIGYELGVHYVVEGVVRRRCDCLRISVRLVDAGSGVQIWSERYDDQEVGLFELQDKVASKVAGAVSASVRASEIAASSHRKAEEPSPYDLVLRGLPLFWRYDRAANQEALSLFNQAVELDPNYALAHAMRAWCLGQQVSHYWAEDSARSRLAAEASATTAAAIGCDNASILVAASAAFTVVDQDPERALELVEEALQIDPNNAWGWMRKGWLLVYKLEAEQAAAAFDKAAELSPFDPMMSNIRAGKAYALALSGDYAGALALQEHALRASPDMSWTLLELSALYMLVGEEDKGRETMQKYRVENPHVTLKTVLSELQHPLFAEAIDPLHEKMVEAGLPRE